MRAGVDVGIDAKCTSGTDASSLSSAIDALELPRRLCVDRFQSELHRSVELVGRFADAAENNIGWRKTCAYRQIDFADRVRVDAAAKLAQQAHDRERRICLHRVVDAVRMERKSCVQPVI